MRLVPQISLRVGALLGTLALTLSAACSHDSTSSVDEFGQPNGSSTGTRNDSTGNNPGTGGNAFAGIRFMSRTMTLLTDGTMGVMVMPVADNGLPSLVLLATRPTLSVSNASIVEVNQANYTVRGVAAGTTKLYATLGSMRDSIVVTVLAERDTLRGTPPTVPPPVRPDSARPTTPPAPPVIPDSARPTPPAPLPVPSFTLTVHAFGRAVPASTRDTANVVQMSGATINVYRLDLTSSFRTDSIGARTLVTTATADATGKAVISNLSSGFYSLEATATYQGAALKGRVDFGPPRIAEFTTAIYLNRQ